MDDLLPVTNVSTARCSESFALTEVKCLKHTHTWVVKGFSQCECRYLETIPNLPILDPQKHVFRVRLHPQGNKDSNKDFCFFQVFSQTSLKYKAKFTVMNVRGEEIPATVYNGTQQLNGYFEYIRREQLIQHIAPQDEIKLVLSLSIVQDTITKTTPGDPALQSSPDSSFTALSRDLNDQYVKEPKFTDFKIICQDDAGKSREINCHRFILYSRSNVFRAMLQEHTGEYKSNSVKFPDIDYEVMNYFVQYLYSGKMVSTNNFVLLQEMLKMGERFEVLELKEAAETALKSQIGCDTVCQLLSLADMHSASILRKDCIRFICHHMSDVLKTPGWSDLLTTYPNIGTECMQMVVNCEESSSEDPPQKRFRIEYHHE